MLAYGEVLEEKPKNKKIRKLRQLQNNLRDGRMQTNVLIKFCEDLDISPEYIIGAIDEPVPYSPTNELITWAKLSRDYRSNEKNLLNYLVNLHNCTKMTLNCAF